MDYLPSTDSLRCFCEAARLLNFRAAARAVALTPAAVSQRLRQLEDQVGARLFERNSRRVSLTQAGLAFLPRAQASLDHALEAVRAARGDVGPAPVELIVGTRHELGMSWLIPMLPELEKAHPQITFHLYFGAGSDLLQRVRMHDVHCAVGSMRISDPRIAWARLHTEAYALVAAPKLLKKTPLTRPEHAANHVLLDLNAELPLFQYLADAPMGDRVKFGRVRLLGTAAAVRALALAGEGVAILPEYQVHSDLKARKLVPLLKKTRPQSDFFRLYFRADDPRRSLYEAVATTMLEFPLR